MIRAIRLASYFFAAGIAAGAVLCGLAFFYGRLPGVSSEVLMVIPGTSWIMLLAGLMLAGCLYASRINMMRRERVVLSLFAVFGVGLLPLLVLLEFLLHDA